MSSRPLSARALRPAVRTLSAEAQGKAEAALDHAGRRRLDAFRTWNRPGALGRLAGRARRVTGLGT
ncbi:hypothetical protein [Streptomyces sp. NBC_00986]|uniref:hypothetical protein n=1 Tax=Streptomyces sp. NBC_00986 TaxID=2903702 RepID=UPI0038632C88|nr:hypothetical protein OG504_13810 [Streptomyces sp. NBC_00986]